MAVYAILLIWILICSQIESKNLLWGGKKILSGRALCLFLAFIPVWFVMAFRALSVGTDTYANASYFISAAGAPSLSYLLQDGFWKVGINLLSYFLGFFHDGLEMYVLYTSTIVSLGFAFFIYKTSVKVWLSTFLFLTLNLYFMSFNISRQFVGIVLAINAFVLIYKNAKSIMGWGLFFFAIWIHNSLASFFPAVLGLWLVKHCRTYTKLYLISLFSALMLSVGLLGVANIFSTFFPHYAIYTQGISGDNLLENTGGGKIIVAYMALGLVLLIHFIKKKMQHKTVENTIFDAFIPGAVFCVVLGIGSATNTMINRITLPYECFFISLIPYVQNTLKLKTKLFFSIFLILGMSAYYFLWAYSNLGDVLPYKTWLF